MPRRQRTLLLFFLLTAGLIAFVYWHRHSAAPPALKVAALETFEGCGMEGDASSPFVRSMNRLKNRYTPPEALEVDPRVTLEAMIEPGDDARRWDERHGAEIRGYVWDVKVGGVETVNCHASDPSGRDTHIELVVDPMNSGEERRAIVEVTPRWRAIMAGQGVDWSTAGLRDHFQGRWVRVRGWLFFDAEHREQSVNTAPGRARDWRATAWEIHPVTSIEVVPRPR